MPKNLLQTIDSINCSVAEQYANYNKIIGLVIIFFNIILSWSFLFFSVIILIIFVNLLLRLMSFMQVRSSLKTEVIEKEDRISLIVKCSIDSHLVFFNNKTYKHYIKSTNQILLQGKIDFSPSLNLESKRSNRVIVLGEGKSSFLCACIDLESNNKPQIRQIQGTIPQKTTKYHIYESDNQQDQNFFIIRIIKNVSNGIAISVYDFRQGIWSEEMIYLSSQYLSYQLINSSINQQAYRQKNEDLCHSFILIGLSARLQMLHYAAVKIVYENNGAERQLKLKFIITRELKHNRQFIPVGALLIEPNQLMLVGNMKVVNQINNQKQSAPGMLIVNTTLIQNNEPQHFHVQTLSFGKQSKERPLLIRKLIGIVDMSIFFEVNLPLDKKGVCTVSKNRKALILQSEKLKSFRTYDLSVSKDCFYSYNLQMENYFERIKKSPSKIQFHILSILGKHLFYRHLLNYGFQGLPQQFKQEIVSIL